ncbi:glycosyltransferase [Marinigracilibium pacificum]|uniref:Glycosyltransferase family 1 protein n=1 Tax=Marinigracilibium pacificum TaxID=2729599 RepID=A0A848IVG5_9BACT|nr:glycosyltransferase [Marinigracilibium pacificum]NMM47231.1 glycosyltransferase family 1 protein [Marinigracilibium pacificum]
MNQDITTNEDIIIFTLSRWDSPISSPSLAIAKEFAKKNRVFYVDHPFSYKDLIGNFDSSQIKQRMNTWFKSDTRFSRPEKLPENLTIVTPGLTVPINFLPQGKLYDYFSNLNDKIILRAITETIEKFDIKDFIFINAFDPFFLQKLPESIKPKVSVYQSMDDISQVAYTHKHGSRLEKETIANYDVTLTTGKELHKIKNQVKGSAYYHPNAADLKLFKRSLDPNLIKPKDWPKEATDKVVGFIGNIETRMDYQLLEGVIDRLKDYKFIFIGPTGTDEYKTIDLFNKNNVFYLGPKKIDELPGYLKYIDVAIIPFKCNTLTKSIYPLKINEYLAAGKPVVATRFSEDILTFSEVISFGSDPEEFAESIVSEYVNNSEKRVEARFKVAEKNTWGARVTQFWDILKSYKNKGYEHVG